MDDGDFRAVHPFTCSSDDFSKIYGKKDGIRPMRNLRTLLPGARVLKTLSSVGGTSVASQYFFILKSGMEFNVRSGGFVSFLIGRESIDITQQSLEMIFD